MNKPRNLPELRFPEFVKDGEWKFKKLDDLAEVVRGGSPRPISEYLTNKDSGLNWLKIGDISEKSKYIDKTSEKIKRQGLSKSRKIKPGDFIISNSMSFGRPYISKIETCIHDGWIAIRDVDEKINIDYLYYLILSEPTQSYFKKKAAGSGVKNLNAGIMKELIVKYPFSGSNPNEQQKIAACLSSLDQLIDLEQEKLDALEAHKKGLLQKLFPEKGKKTPEYRFSEFEEEWAEEELINLADKNEKWSLTGGPFGSDLKKSDYTSKGIRIIQLQNMGDGEFLNNYKIYTSTKKADELLSSNIYSGEILIAKMGDPVGRASIIPGENERFLMASDGIRLVVDKEKYDRDFIFYLINSNVIRNKIKSKSTGSTRKRIGLNNLKKIKIVVPQSLKEQQRIGRLIASIDRTIREQAQRKEELKSHKKGLLQQLFP